MQEAHKASANKENVLTGLRKNKQRLGNSRARGGNRGVQHAPYGEYPRLGPHWGTEEREIHRVPRWGSVACYKKQVNAEGKEVVYWAAALCL